MGRSRRDRSRRRRKRRSSTTGNLGFSLGRPRGGRARFKATCDCAALARGFRSIRLLDLHALLGRLAALLVPVAVIEPLDLFVLLKEVLVVVHGFLALCRGLRRLGSGVLRRTEPGAATEERVPRIAFTRDHRRLATQIVGHIDAPKIGLTRTKLTVGAPNGLHVHAGPIAPLHGIEHVGPHPATGGLLLHLDLERGYEHHPARKEIVTTADHEICRLVLER